MSASVHLALLHADMLGKEGEVITTSLTMIDTHDISRSARTYGIKTCFFAHPSDALKKLARRLKSHWQEGYGATHNPDRKEALTNMQLVSSLDEAIRHIETNYGVFPKLIATSAIDGDDRVRFKDFREKLAKESKDEHYLLLFGTGWGMSDELTDRCDYFLEPIYGVGEYNHLSVRSACAIILDRMFG